MRADKLKTTYRVCSVQDIPVGGSRIFEVQGVKIGIFNVSGQWFAWRNMCPHGAAPVCEGVVCGTRMPSNVYEYEYGRDREVLRCPWHGWEFDLLTGRHLAEGSDARLRGYRIEVSDEDLFISL